MWDLSSPAKDGTHVPCAKRQILTHWAIRKDHSTIDEVRARMRAQEIEKDLQRADLVVNNDGKTEIMVICLQIQDFFRNFAGWICFRELI